MSSKSLKILLVGSGGRSSVSNISDTAADDYPRLVQLSQTLGMSLVVAGLDQAVVDGIEGYFRGSGIPCFAPSKEAADIEGSKTFAKAFMERHAIPTAAYKTFTRYSIAKQYTPTIDDHHRVVIKVDGLAAGKGVILPVSQNEAHRTLEEIMLEGKFGAEVGSSIVIEEYMTGDEISILTFSDGKTTRTLPPCQDHKRAYDGDRGPYTGGMGVYTPVPFVTAADMEAIETQILQPTFRGLEAEGRPFMGMLFTGVMLTSEGPKVIEYNARFGDPETQALMPLLRDTDLAEVLLAYVRIFHAGTKYIDGQLVVAGGRVFSVSANGPTLRDAVDAAYSGVKSIRVDGTFYRTDIASR
ncbi:putative bifunctional purine Ade1 [Xylariaceae sp. FL0255]|nr:putative bifunctional purine Ade1 [Xylariaceae sp. FL0255]